jgi:hypothetical protein
MPFASAAVAPSACFASAQPLRALTVSCTCGYLCGLQLGKLQFSQQFANIQQLMMAMAPAMGPPMPIGAKGGARGPVASQRPPSGEYGYEAPPPAVQTAPQGQGGQLKR